MSTNTTLIEINGVKMEVDLRHAKRVENIKVGCRVKVLRKEYSSYKVSHGVVIGFEPFEKLPTIIIAALTLSYNDAKIEFVYFNAESVDTEVVISVDPDSESIDKQQVLDYINREISKRENEITELENRRAYFLAQFSSYWTPADKSETAAA